MKLIDIQMKQLTEQQVTVTRRVRGSNNKVALKSIDFVNLATGNAKVVKSKIIKVLDNTTNNDYKRSGNNQ